MISEIIYGLRYLSEHPLQALAATGIFGFSKNRAIVNLRYALARIAYYTAERAVFDAGNIGKLLYQDLTLPKGAARPPIWRGSQGQKAVQAGRTRAATQIARVGAPVARFGAFLLSAPARPYLIAAAATTTAGFAVGRTRGVRTAPALQTGYVLGAPV